MAVYGNAIDSANNPGAQLYIPGKTKLAKGDVWLGGVSTLADDQLNGATRVSGANRQATADAYTNYQTGQAKSAGLQSQLDASNARLKTQADTKANMEGLKQAQLQASMAGLGKARDSSLSNLSAEKATIEPQYQKQKMQANVTAKQTARSFDEYMAQRGGGVAGDNKSGIGGQGTMLNLMGYQGQKGALDQAEAGAITDNARRVTDVGNNYESDVVGAEAGIQSQYLQNYINQMNQDKQFGLQEAGLTGNYNGQQTMAGAQSSASLSLTNAQLKEMQDPNSVTNQMSRIGLDTAKLNFAQLPAQLQAQAQQIAQDAQMGKITLQQAQINLDYLPRQMELGMAQTQAQISASNRSNTGGRGGSGGSSRAKSITQSSTQGKANMDDAMIEANNQIMNGARPGDVVNAIEQQRASLAKQGINVDSLIKAVWGMSGIQTKPEVQDSWR